MRPDEVARQNQVMLGISVVANIHKDKGLVTWAENHGLLVRIGRPSKWGNPYIIGRDGDRDDICDKFEKKRLPDLRSRICELQGKVLACYCYPARCHGDSLAFLANLVREGSKNNANPN